MIIQKLTLRQEFTHTENKIADYILNNLDKIAFMSSKELADETYSAASAITRLCHKVGAKGYMDLKVRIASEVSEDYVKTLDIDVNAPFTKGDSTEKIISTLAKVAIQSIDEMKNLIDPEMIDRICNRIIKAKCIELFGEGASFSVMESFYYKMTRSGYNIIAQKNSDLQLYQAANTDKDHVAIMISHSGNRRSNFSNACFVKKNNAALVVITSRKDTPLAELADYLIVTGDKENKYMQEKFDLYYSQFSVQYILDCIYSNISIKDYDRRAFIMKKHDEMAKIYNNVPNKLK